jgi:hypothetical protein
MGRGISVEGIIGESGFIAGVNSSGQLAVDATVEVGAVSVGISGQPLYAYGQEFVTSGFQPIPLTQSGMGLSGVQYKVIVGFSGDSVLTSVSGNVIIGKISGETVSIAGGVTISGNVVNTSISGNVVNTSVSGNIISITTGQNVISKISGETVIALISGQFVNTSIDLSGVTLNVDNITTNVSGQVVVGEISGQTVRFGTSGFSYAHLQAYDYSGNAWSNLAVNSSGGHSLNVAASFQADISGQTVRTFAASGQNAVYITNQSGNLAVIVDTSGRLAVTTSGASISVISGTGVRISGETVSTSVSGNVISVSGGVSKTSGETIRIWQGSGHNGVFITNQSGNLFTIVDASGRLAVTTSGAVVSVNSGTGVRISGDTIVLTSGAGVRISGDTVIAKISGESITAANTVSGNIPVASLSTISGVALLVAEPTKTFFMAYQTLQITSASGGATLLSGDSRVISVRNIGQSGSIMFVGSSGTSRAPWVATEFSGWGWQLKDGDSITIPVFNPAVIRVVSLTSGQPVSYAINNY